MTFSCRGEGVWSRLDTYGSGRGWYKKSQGGSWVWKYAFSIQFEQFRGSRKRAQRLGEIRGERIMTFSCRGKVWGVDWIHLVWVGVGIKKSQGGSWVWKYAFSIQFEQFRGSRKRAQRLGEIRGERR